MPGVTRHDAVPVLQTFVQRVDVDLVHQIDGGDGVKDGISMFLGGNFILLQFQFSDPILKVGDALGQGFESGYYILVAGGISFTCKGRGNRGSAKVESDGVSRTEQQDS